MITTPPRVWLEEHGKNKSKDAPMTGAMVNYLRFNQSHFLSSQ